MSYDRSHRYDFSTRLCSLVRILIWVMAGVSAISVTIWVTAALAAGDDDGYHRITGADIALAGGIWFGSLLATLLAASLLHVAISVALAVFDGADAVQAMRDREDRREHAARTKPIAQRPLPSPSPRPPGSAPWREDPEPTVLS